MRKVLGFLARPFLTIPPVRRWYLRRLLTYLEDTPTSKLPDEMRAGQAQLKRPEVARRVGLARLDVLGRDDDRDQVGEAGGGQHERDLGAGCARDDGDGYPLRRVPDRCPEILGHGRAVRDRSPVAGRSLL